MEKLDEIPEELSSVSDQDERMKYFIGTKGKKGFFQFIIHLAKAVIELNTIGIFHGDLAFRNLCFKGDTLKLIDFDCALKVTTA